MGRFTKIPKNTFDSLQMDAGILLNQFNVETPNVQDADIICATTGGISISCVPTYSDQGADVDNCPNNTKELKKLDGWDCKISFTALTVTKEVIALALGASTTATDKVTPNRNLTHSKDFSDKWWVGDKADGGCVAVCIKNALSTAGLTLKTTKNGKGQITIELTGHVSIESQDTMPIEFYVKAAPGVGG